MSAERSTSGDGFFTLSDGSVRWGRFGAAGILVRHRPGPAHDGDAYFLARRSSHTHLGGTWAIPGGALQRDETPLCGAVREFEEEIGTTIGEFTVVETFEDDQGGWSYWTIVVDVPERFAVPGSLGWETAEARWVPRDEIAGLELFDAFRRTLRTLGLI